MPWREFGFVWNFIDRAELSLRERSIAAQNPPAGLVEPSVCVGVLFALVLLAHVADKDESEPSENGG